MTYRNNSDSDRKQNGILPSQWIREAIIQKIIDVECPISPSQIQPNSLDLRLSGNGYRMQCSFLPGDEGVNGKLNRGFKWADVQLSPNGTLLERDLVYLFPLQESLSLPPNVSGRANPKSSTGRLDIFTRVVTETGSSFDTIPPNYKGKLYLEVVPRSFPVIVREGDALAQIRFQVGDAQLSRDELICLVDKEELIIAPGGFGTIRSRELVISDGIFLSVSMPSKDEPTVGFRARKHSRPIDLRGKHKIRHYWERIHGDNRPVILQPDEFYIFASRELVRLPPAYCAEMVPVDPSSGELRTHYAGFFDSGFGFVAGRPASFTAASVVLEIRSRDVAFLIEDGQSLFRLNILHNTEPPDVLYGTGISSNYQGQRLKLSKQFTGLEEEDDQYRLDI
jgi:dCTP deaminase